MSDVPNEPIPEEKGRVLTRGHGFPVDHIALAVPDTEGGVRYVEQLTGVTPTLTRRDKQDFYWSAALAIGADSFLEVIGPNPDHRGIHPLKSFMAGLNEPTLLFWYVATDDFEAFSRRAAAAGVPLEHIVTVSPETSANKSDYTRAVVGSGFVSQQPGVIEWRRQSVGQSTDIECRLTGFSLSLPEPDDLNAVFASLDIDVTVKRGPSRIGLTLETPKGEIVIENPGHEMTPLKMISAVIRRPFG